MLILKIKSVNDSVTYRFVQMITLFYLSLFHHLITWQCYFVGGTDDAATGILGNLIRPLSYHMPESKICEKLKAMDGQICELRYGE